MAKVAQATVTTPLQSKSEYVINGVPDCGLAIFPEWASADSKKFILKGYNVTKGMITSNMSGDPVLFVDGEYSASGRRTITDANDNEVIYQIRKERSGGKQYVAELEDEGKPLFEITKRRRMLHRDTFIVTFVNKADPSRGMVEMEYTPPLVVNDGYFRINENMVCLVKKEGVGPASSGWYYLTLEPKVDLTLIVGAMVAVIERMKDESSKSTAY